MPLQLAGQHHWTSTVLEEEPQAPGYGTQNCGIATTDSKVIDPASSPMTGWCASMPRLATSLGRHRIRRASFLSRKYPSTDTHNDTETEADTVSDTCN